MNANLYRGCKMTAIAKMVQKSNQYFSNFSIIFYAIIFIYTSSVCNNWSKTTLDTNTLGKYKLELGYFCWDYVLFKTYWFIYFLINKIFEIFFKNLNCINILNKVHLIILYVFMWSSYGFTEKINTSYLMIK